MPSSLLATLLLCQSCSPGREWMHFLIFPRAAQVLSALSHPTSHFSQTDFPAARCAEQGKETKGGLEMKLFFILNITAEDESGATSPRCFCLPSSPSQSHTGKMNMQHFLFVLLKRPLNASREKPDMNTHSPPCLREGRSILPSGEETASSWERLGRGRAPSPAEHKTRGASLVLSLQTWQWTHCVSEPLLPPGTAGKGFHSCPKPS